MFKETLEILTSLNYNCLYIVFMLFDLEAGSIKHGKLKKVLLYAVEYIAKEKEVKQAG